EEDLARRTERELLERIAALQGLQVDLLVRRFGYVLPGLLIGQGLTLLLRLAAGGDAPRLQADLLAAVPCATTAANQELGRLARHIRASGELRRIFREESPEQVPARLGEAAGPPAGRALLAEVASV